MRKTTTAGGGTCLEERDGWVDTLYAESMEEHVCMRILGALGEGTVKGERRALGLGRGGAGGRV